MNLVIACVPVDRSRLPQIPELDALVVTDLYSAGECSRCDEPVWIGPRQLAVHQDGGKPIVCYYCLFSDLDAGKYGEVDLIPLGGGYPREGIPRVTP